ncbi:MAG: ABC transporter permease [Spirochaetaceae bacterium]
MNLRSQSFERVTLLGAIIGSVSLFFPFVVVKENRVVEGVAHFLWELPAPLLFGVLAAALLGSLVLSRMGESLRIRYAKVGGGLVIFTAALLLLSNTGFILEREGFEFGRIAPSVGFWLLMLSSFVLVDGSLRNAPVSPTARTIISVAPFVILAALLVLGSLDDLAILKEFHNRRERFVREFFNHIYLSGTAVSFAVIIGVPLGLLAWKRSRLERPIFVVVNGIQTIPSLALFGLMIAPLAYLSQRFPALRQMGIQGIGNAPALIALTLYALLPIVRNAYTSLAVIPDAVVDAGSGVGMNRRQLLRFVEFPLSIPIVLSGIRTSAVQAVGNTAVAALIGAGGLGRFVFQGLGQAAPDLIVMGVLPIIFMAVALDRILGLVIDRVTPRGSKRELA